VEAQAYQRVVYALILCSFGIKNFVYLSGELGWGKRDSGRGCQMI